MYGTRTRTSKAKAIQAEAKREVERVRSATRSSPTLSSPGLGTSMEMPSFASVSPVGRPPMRQPLFDDGSARRTSFPRASPQAGNINVRDVYDKAASPRSTDSFQERLVFDSVREVMQDRMVTSSTQTYSNNLMQHLHELKELSDDDTKALAKVIAKLLGQEDPPTQYRPAYDIKTAGQLRNLSKMRPPCNRYLDLHDAVKYYYKPRMVTA